MLSPSQARRRTLLWLLLAGLLLLAAGALQARRDYLLRGIPAGMPPPIAHGGARLGLNVDLGQYDAGELAAALAEIAALNVTHVKHSFHFTPDFDWEAADASVSAVDDAGLTLVPLLDGNPADDFAPPADPAAYAAWAAAFAGRFGTQIDHYIIWDEPNLGSHWGNRPVNPFEYAALLSAAAQAIRAADQNAVIVAAPLAPTVETGPDNLADHLYLQRLYEVGAAEAFDIAAAKPYGFDSGPEDRAVDPDLLNFSRVILLREVMVANGDEATAIWAGNWGWNSLPDEWEGPPSIWGAVDAATQTEWTLRSLERARQEWPWMGLMFLEQWDPAGPTAGPDADPRTGFRVRGAPLAAALVDRPLPAGVAYPGFHLARADDPAQAYQGGWRFAPEFGADISQSGDAATFTFWGTDVALRVRRANFRARLHVTVDGQPANALPRDETGAALVLTAPDPAQDYLATEIVARDLEPGAHSVTVVADRGWDQWALNGFSVAYRPVLPWYPAAPVGLLLGALLALGLALRAARRGAWSAWLTAGGTRFRQLTHGRQAALTGLAALAVGLTGWLTWGDGIYRRLGDVGQLTLTAAAAGVFYVSPTFVLYVAAAAVLFVLLAFRPLWGVTLILFSAPFYRYPRPMAGYQFSAVEIFTLLTVGAVLLHALRRLGQARGRARPRLTGADWAVVALVGVATASLFFTERLDVATNEWRVIVLEPALFYLALRLVAPDERERWWLVDAFTAGAVVVALIGLAEYVTGADLITAEGGLFRLRSVYGSPNNVALYFGRVLPFVAAAVLLGDGKRRLVYAAAALPLGVAFLLTFSKGGLLLGLPAGLLVVFILWQRRHRRRVWPWLLAGGAAAAAAFLIALQIPVLAARLDPRGDTSFVRFNLWRASVEMIADHPLFGVGLDNFLYAHRGRYILQAAWREPDLSHPHNLLLDFATRLGTLGLLVGAWLFGNALRGAWGLWRRAESPLAAGLLGALAAVLAHGLVDHGYFLIDLAYAFFLIYGLGTINQ